MSLLDYHQRFSALRMNRTGGKPSPHKVAMLQAVMDLVEQGDVTDNRFYFNESLKQRFTANFLPIQSSADRNNPHLPFFHLRSETFWHHKIRAGQREAYQLLNTASSQGIIAKHIEYAYLEDELFELLQSKVARELFRAALFNNLDEVAVRAFLQTEGGGWDWLEYEVVVSDYLSMLKKQLTGSSYSKARQLESILPRLRDRSELSVQNQHQKVSAILLELGLPYIVDYKPVFTYEQQLKQVVLSHLASRQDLLDDVLDTGESVAEGAGNSPWDNVFDPQPPERIAQVSEAKPQYLASRIDYVERERRNRKLGQQAEEFVLGLERQRLSAEGRSDLAAEVEWSSKLHGDGLGYDIRSFDSSCGEERFLEVKATRLGKYQPFFISENERAFSNDYERAFRLYRVYEFGPQSRLFVLPGAIERHVQLQPRIYKARF